MLWLFDYLLCWLFDYLDVLFYCSRVCGFFVWCFLISVGSTWGVFELYLGRFVSCWLSSSLHQVWTISTWTHNSSQQLLYLHITVHLVFLWLFVTMHRLKNVKNCILLCVVFIHNLALFSFQIVTLTPYSGKTIKISNFWKFKMAAAAIWKITKIAITPQRFDRSLRNLVRWCKMSLLTVKKIRISQIQDGGRPPF